MNFAKLLGAAAVAVFAIGGHSAHASTITTLFNTGVDASGTPLANDTSPDPHYTLASVPGGTSVTLVRIRGAADDFPIPPYLGDNTTSAWIGPNNAHDLTSPAGPYDYRTTFDLTGFNPATASISGQWSSDNAGLSIYLNGVLTSAPGNPYGTDPNFSFTHWVSFLLTTGFQAGINTLDFFVQNGNGGSDLTGPTALRVEMLGDATATPLPAALPLFAGGLGVIGLIARRRKRSIAKAVAA